MPTLEPVGRDNAPTQKYVPIQIPVIGHSLEDGSEVSEIFEFRPTVNMGAALTLLRNMRENDGIMTYAMVLTYLEQSMSPREFDSFMAFIGRPDLEVQAQTIADVREALAAEYLKDRPTPARSSSGRAKPKRTSAAGAGGRG